MLEKHQEGPIFSDSIL
nr:unnamed protein product [Callosobruchus analis]